MKEAIEKAVRDFINVEYVIRGEGTSFTIVLPKEFIWSGDLTKPQQIAILEKARMDARYLEPVVINVILDFLNAMDSRIYEGYESALNVTKDYLQTLLDSRYFYDVVGGTIAELKL